MKKILPVLAVLLLAPLGFLLLAPTIPSDPAESAASSATRADSPAGNAATPAPASSGAPASVPAPAANAPARVAPSQQNLEAELRRTLDSMPASPLRTAVLMLEPEARQRALFHFGKLQLPPQDVANIRVSPDGALYVVCHGPTPDDLPKDAHGQIAWQSSPPLTVASPVAPGDVGGPPVALASPVPVSAPPVRHSRPGAPNLLVIEFSGGPIANTAWTASTPIVYESLPFDTDGDPTTFSASEQADIIAVWQRVADHFAPFDVNVTTERPGTYPQRSARVMFTRSIDATGRNMPGITSTGIVGGIAYLGQFGSNPDPLYYGTTFVYFDKMGSAANGAITSSHELGHTFGLTHQGTATDAYYYGHGTGPLRWAPIMGSAFGGAITQWAKGDYFGATNTQDATALLGHILGYRSPSTGNGIFNSAGTDFTNPTTIATDGVIRSPTDRNFYSFNVTGGTVDLTVQGFVTSTGLPGGGSGHWKLELFEAASQLRVGVTEFPPTTDASLTVSVPRPGIYVAVISGSASYNTTTANVTGTPFDPDPATRANFTGYGSAGQYRLTGTVAPSRPFITGTSPFNCRVGVPFYHRIKLSNFPRTLRLGQAPLPPGITLDVATGVMSGTPTAAGSSTVEITAENEFGSTMAVFSFNVAEPLPVITDLSGTQRLAFGASTTLSVDATSAAGALSYQWFHNGQAIPGATASTHRLENFTIAQEGWYQVKVSNRAGTVPSRAVFVLPAPTSTVLTAWGYTADGQANVPPGTNDLVAIGSGAFHTLGLRANGTVIAWGYNNARQASVPPGLTDVVAVRGAYYNSIALRGDGTVVAWGWPGSTLTLPPPGLNDVVAIDAGAAHAIALRADGSVVVWGEPGHSALNVSPTVKGFGAIAIAAGLEHCLAIQPSPNQIIVGWGDNTYKQGTPTGYIPNYPVFVTGGYMTSYMLRANGTFFGWGGITSQTYYPYTSNYHYNLYSLPADTPNLRVVLGGWRHSLGLRHDGTVLAVGINGNGNIPPTLTRAFHIATKFETSFALSDSSSYVAPAITQQPISATVAPGSAAAFSVTATGEPAPLYQWRRDGTPLPGATSRDLLIASVSAAETGNYDVVVTNAAGSVTSAPAALRLSQSISFSPPTGLSFPRATPVTLTASASSGLPVTFAVISGPATVSGDQLTLTGSGEIVVRALQAGDATYAATFADQTLTVLGGFAAWQASKFTSAQLADPALSGELADPDRDDFSNLAEYALGLEPLTNTPLAAGPSLTWDGTSWIYAWQRPTDRTDVTYTVETSQNLTTWSSSGLTPTLIASANGTDTWRVTLSPGSARKHFFRLVITR